MGRKCSVKSCPSNSLKPEHAGVTYHKIPLHRDIRPKWLLLCHIPNERMDSKMLFVCSRHFLRADFCNFKGKKYMLKQGVLPSVFPWDKSRLEAIKAEVNIKKDELESPKKKDGIKEVMSQDVNSDDCVKPGPSQLETQKNCMFLSKATETKVEPSEIDAEIQNAEGKCESNIEQGSHNMIDVKEESHPDPQTSIKESEFQDVLDKTDAFDQHQRSQNASPVRVAINFNINSRIEVMDNNNVWYLAKINEVDYEESEVLIHFEKAINKCDEWISMSSPRLRPFQAKPVENFEVGERCMATWSDYRKFPATITRKLPNDSYEVLFDDGFVKVVKNHKMVKIKPMQSSPLFEPAKTTKQERRDKKRKLNVAALFSKRPKLSHTDDKKKTSPVFQTKAAIRAETAQVQEDRISSPTTQLSQEESFAASIASVEMSSSSPDWHPSWENGKPVGIESTIDGADGLRKSTIVPDPRLPQGWAKHLTQRTYGQSVGKWDAVILAPDGKKFRTKQDVQNYLDLHPEIETSVAMFDFSVYRGRRGGKPRQKVPTEVATPAMADTEKARESPVQEMSTKEEEPPISLKIVFEDDVYRCPIEGCGKNFRRENLALMHVKHYHSEYTKYLESMPNVADLAYARTVGENLDRSPGPPKPSLTTAKLEKTQVTQKVPKTSAGTTQEVVATSEDPLIAENTLRDSEIIKLLNQKSSDVSNDVQPLPSGLPSSMYPDIKLKDLLGKNDDTAMRDDVHIKTLCSSRPFQGIKTLLPVRHSNKTTESADENAGFKRKKVAPLLIETTEAIKGKPILQTTPVPILETPLLHQSPSSQQPHQATLTNSQPPLVINGALAEANLVPSAFDLAPPPAGLEITQAPSVTQYDGVIFEGGKIIKLERMKQEEIINCTCGFTEEDGLMIQCELCLCWQHAYCNNIQKESEVPEKYVCYICQHPLRERQSAKYFHDQDWLKQGVLPVASYHHKDRSVLEKRFEKLKKCHDVSGGLLELRDYMHTLAIKLKVAEAKNHPKLYLWSKPWEKQPLPEKNIKEESADVKPKIENPEFHQHSTLERNKLDNPNDTMLMMMLKPAKEEMPMLNMHSTLPPIIPRPEAAIDSDDCKLNLLEHISHSECLVDERLDDFEKQLDSLERGMILEREEDFPRARQTLQLLMRDLDSLKRFSELPMM